MNRPSRNRLRPIQGVQEITGCVPVHVQLYPLLASRRSLAFGLIALSDGGESEWHDGVLELGSWASLTVI